MSLTYFNQNNYACVPYPAPGYSTATLKSGGCGVVCVSMIIANMTAQKIDPKDMAAYSIQVKARVSGGTDMNVLANAVAKDYHLDVKTTNNESILLDHLKSGGMAVANVGGNRPGYTGVFSDGGHFIVCAGLADDGEIIVLDPGLYTEKFNKPGRVGKVKVNGNYCYCDISVLTMDTASRSPSYWLFVKKGVESEMKIGMEIPEVKTILNGVVVENAVILNVDGKDTTYIPALALKNAGMSVEWDATNATVIIKKDEQ